MNPRCPKCGSEAVWELQDMHTAKEDESVVFSERLLICSSSCGWHGDFPAWFPWKDVEGKFKISTLIDL